MKFIIFISMLTLAALSCGMPVNTQPVTETIMEVSYPNPSPAPVPKMVLQEKQMVCGFWNVREKHDPNSKYLGTVFNGSFVTLTGKDGFAPDKGKWVQVRGRDVSGWMNAKGLCEVTK